MSLRLKLLLFISALFITAIGNAIFTFQLESYAEDKLKWVNHTHEVIIATDHFLSYVQDAETGQRGFLLTEDSDYLEPYYSGSMKAKEHIAELKEMTSDNPKQQQRLGVIEKFMQLKLDELDETIKLTQQNNNHNSKALEIIKRNNGKQYMDNIRLQIKEFINAEELLLEQRKGDFRESRAKITTLITMEIMFFVFLALMTVSFLNKNLFAPLKLLLLSTHKMQDGKRVDVLDITSKDEMGYLLSSFIMMNEQVYKRTESLDHKAHHDELTGLKNRAKVYTDIQNAIDHLKEFKTKFTILFIDLNKFKELNDTLGHDAGDAMLKETALRLQESVRSNDTVYRLGGDEFLILINNIHDVSEIQNIVSNILEACKRPMMIQGQPVEISLSIGIAISPDDTNNSDEILKYSDIAMYEAKRAKDTNYKFFDRSMLKRDSDA